MPAPRGWHEIYDFIAPRGDGGGMKCLLVDDEPGIREGLAMLLRRRGIEVDTAGDCAAAAEHLANQVFDVVVTDWRLPDGVALSFAADCPAPVLAVSGHPEEVECSGSIQAVMAKPVRPQQLLDRITACGAAPPAEAEDDAELPRDVKFVIDDVLAQLPDGLDVACHDDGTFVVVRVKLPDGDIPTVNNLGGDLRILGDQGSRELELRLYRDGRLDTTTAVARLEDAWPQCDVFALDCHGTAVDGPTYSALLADVAKHHARGGRIFLLNVPKRLDSITSVWANDHDMPMRERVGPRLSAELADLWS
jgi:CheY-like chemotaxis protein